MTQMPSIARTDIPGIQYLRGLAALMVVVFHMSYQLSRIYPLYQVDTLASGVDIFFVISGFVMIYSTNGGSRFSPSAFMLNRVVRIAPLYWAATFLTIFAIIFAPGLVKTAKLAFPHALLSLLFIAVPNPVGLHISPLVVVGWTLNLEMFFYLIFAGAIALGRRSSSRVGTYVLTALCALAIAGLILRVQGVAGFYVNPLLLEFAYGIVLAMVYRRSPRVWPRWAAWLGLAVILVLVLPPEGDTTFRCFRYGLPATLLVMLATYVNLPRWRLPHRLGDISYSLYISHFFTLSAFAQIWRKLPKGHVETNIISFYAVGTVCAVIVAYCCWRWVETPLTALAKRLLTAWHGHRADKAAATSRT